MFLRLDLENVEEGEWRAFLTWQSSLGCTPPCRAEGLLWIQTIKHQHFSSLSFCLYSPISVSGARLPWGLPGLLSVRLGAAKTVCQFFSWRSHGVGDLQSQSAGNSSRMAGDKSHLHIPRSRILFRWQLLGDEMETSV